MVDRMTRVSAAEARALLAKADKAAKPSKYRAKRTVVDGISFDSKREAQRYQELRLMERAGEIRGLRRQVPFPIEINGLLITTYMADFVYRVPGAEVDTIEDAKGVRTKEYRLKKRMVRAVYGRDIKET